MAYDGSYGPTKIERFNTTPKKPAGKPGRPPVNWQRRQAQRTMFQPKAPAHNPYAVGPQIPTWPGDLYNGLNSRGQVEIHPFDIPAHHGTQRDSSQYQDMLDVGGQAFAQSARQRMVDPLVQSQDAINRGMRDHRNQSAQEHMNNLEQQRQANINTLLENTPQARERMLGQRNAQPIIDAGGSMGLEDWMAQRSQGANRGRVSGWPKVPVPDGVGSGSQGYVDQQDRLGEYDIELNENGLPVIRRNTAAPPESEKAYRERMDLASRARQNWMDKENAKRAGRKRMWGATRHGNRTLQNYLGTTGDAMDNLMQQSGYKKKAGDAEKSKPSVDNPTEDWKRVSSIVSGGNVESAKEFMQGIPQDQWPQLRRYLLAQGVSQDILDDLFYIPDPAPEWQDQRRRPGQPRGGSDTDMADWGMP